MNFFMLFFYSTLFYLQSNRYNTIKGLFYVIFDKSIKKKLPENLQIKNKCVPLHSLSGTNNKRKKFTKRAFSSAGSEHLPYKQRVGGSNPSTPTKNSQLD